MTIEVRRYGHGSRVPGWDEGADLSKDPSPVPDPATTPVPEVIAALREGREVLPDKHLVRRPVADPNANTPKGPTAYGAEMEGDAEGPVAPIEQAPSTPDEEA